MEYSAFLTFTLGATSYYWGSREDYRSGHWFDGILASWPTPQEAWPDEYGLLPIQQFDIEVSANSAVAALINTAGLIGAAATLELVNVGDQPSYIQDEAGGILLDETGAVMLDEQDGHVERVYTKGVSIAGYRLRPGVLALTLADIDNARLDALYPSRTFTTADWSELFIEHVGRAVPWATGTAIKVPLSLIQTNSGAGPWVYAACEAPATVLTVYRDGRIVDASEYTIGTVTAASGYTVVKLTFALEQTDASGRHYELSADMSGPASRNAATELSRLLTAAGLTIDSASFAAATAQAAAIGMTVDCRYAEQRTYRAITNDLALILRGHIYRTYTGAIGIMQDITGVSRMALDEIAGDLLEVQDLTSTQQPETIELRYKPSPRDPSALLHTLSRSAGGVSGVTRYEAPYLSDHTAADKLACYLALRAQYGQRLRARVYGEDVALGDILTLSSAIFWAGSKAWRVARISRPAMGAELELIQYDAAIYTYTAGTLPADAVTGYQPDYSETPPAAPTSLTIVSSGAVAAANSVTAWVKVKATPPAANWIQMWFAATNDSTDEVYQVQGTDNGDGTWGATIPALRPNVAHHVIAWAVSKTGVSGVTASTTHTSATTAVVQVATVNTSNIANSAVGTTQIADSNVTTAKRQAVSTSTFSVTLGAGGFTQRNVTHGLGKTPVATSFAGTTAFDVWVSDIDSTWIQIAIWNFTGGSTTATVGMSYW